jgi:hypothetical protein
MTGLDTSATSVAYITLQSRSRDGTIGLRADFIQHHSFLA